MARYNLLRYEDATFETSVNNYVAQTNASSFGISSTVRYSGLKALRWTATAAGDSKASIGHIQSKAIPVLGGKAYGASAYIYHNGSSSKYPATSLVWFDKDFNYISYDYTQGAYVNSTTWTFMSTYNKVAPANAAYVRLDIGLLGMSAGNYIYIDNLNILQQTTSMNGAYVDPILPANVVNMLDLSSSGFEKGTGLWEGVSNLVSLTSTTAKAQTGSRSLQALTSTTGNSKFALGQNPAALIPISATTTYTIGASAIRQSGTGYANILFVWYDSSKNYLGYEYLDSNMNGLNASTWATGYATATSPSNAAYVRIDLEHLAVTGGESTYWDNIALYEGAYYAFVAPTATAVSDTQDSTFNVEATALTKVSNTQGSTYDVYTSVSSSQASTFNISTSLSDTQESTFDVRTSVSQSLDTTWDIETPPISVTSTQPSEFDVYSTVSATLESTFRNDAAILAVIEATFDVMSVVSDTQDSEFDITLTVSQSVTSEFDITATIADTVTSEYDVFVESTDTLTVDWDIFTPVTVDEDAEWAITSSVDVTLDSIYEVAAEVTYNTPSTYDIASYVATDVNSDWDIYEVASEVTSTEWDIFTSVTETVDSTFYVGSGVFQHLDSTFDVAGKAAATVDSTFDIAEPVISVSTTLDSTFDALSLVFPTQPSLWDISTAVSDTAPASWDIRTATSDTLPASWDIVGKVTSTTSSSFDIGALVTATRTSTWDITETERTVYNNFNGGVDGVQITTANSDGYSGTAFTDVTGPIQYTSTLAHNSGLGMYPLAGTRATVRMTTGYSSRKLVARTYIYFANSLTANQRLMTIIDSPNVGGIVGITSDERIYSRFGGVDPAVTGNISLSSNTWYRIEAVLDTNVGLGVYVYLGDSLTPLETIFDNFGSHSSYVSNVDFGRYETSVMGQSIFMDDLAVRTGSTTLIGPAPSQVSDTLTSRWNVTGRITKTLDTQWDITGGTITKTLDVQWDISAKPVALMPSEWYTLELASKTADIEYDIREEVLQEVVASWREAINPVSTLKTLWQVEQLLPGLTDYTVDLGSISTSGSLGSVAGTSTLPNTTVRTRVLAGSNRTAKLGGSKTNIER